MNHTTKFETAVLTFLEGTPNTEWTPPQCDLLNIASTVDRLTEDLTVVRRRLVRSIDEINEAVGRNASYISPLHGNYVMEFSETLAKFTSFREALYVMVGAVLGPEAKKQFLASIGRV
jgi:hypothetical protein